MRQITWLVAMLAVVLQFGTSTADSCKAIGLSDFDDFPDANFFSTSYAGGREPHKVREGSSEAWCANSGALDELTIDLGRIFRLCAVQTSGIGSDYLLNFTLTFSLDNATFGDPEYFDRSTGAAEDYESFSSSISARYVKLEGHSFNGNPCVSELELYRKTGQCAEHPVGISDSFMIPDGQISASSTGFGFFETNARLSQNNTWCANTTSSPYYLQIDFGQQIDICAIETEGFVPGPGAVYFTTDFILQYSDDGSNFDDYNEDGSVRTFTRVRGINREYHRLFDNLTAQYLRVIITDHHGAQPCLSLEVYRSDAQGDCFDEDVPFDEVTVRSGDPTDVFLKSDPGWCAGISPPSGDVYVQIDFGSLHTVCAVAVRGGPGSDKFPTRFKLRFAVDHREIWYTYEEQDDVDREYVIAPADGSVIVKRNLAQHQAARFVRFLITEHQGSEACLRVEVWGRIAVNITCKRNGRVDVQVAHGVIGPDISQLTLNVSSPACTFPVNHGVDTTFSFNVDECGTRSWDNSVDDYLYFSNTINGEAYNASGNIPTQTRDFHFPVICKYDQTDTVSDSFTPLHDLSGESEGSGEFTFSMNLYTTSNHDAAYNGEIVNLGTTLYAKVEVAASDFGKTLMITRCWTTPTANRNDLTSVELIEDGCEVDGVPEILDFNYTCATSTLSQQFDFEAYRFPADRSTVHFHCDLRVCSTDDPSNSCDNSCRGCSRRKRRSSKENQGNGFDQENIYSVDFGPINVKDDQQEKAPASAKGALGTTGVIVLVISGLLVLAIVCVTFFIARRMRRKPAHDVTDGEQNGQYIPDDLTTNKEA